MKDKYDKDEILSFADGLKAFNTKGHRGVPVRMTKARALALKFFAKEMVYCVPDCEHTGTGVDDCNCRDDYHAAIAWINQEVNKRYSSRDLAL